MSMIFSLTQSTKWPRVVIIVVHIKVYFVYLGTVVYFPLNQKSICSLDTHII